MRLNLDLPLSEKIWKIYVEIYDHSRTRDRGRRPIRPEVRGPVGARGAAKSDGSAGLSLPQRRAAPSETLDFLTGFMQKTAENDRR